MKAFWEEISNDPPLKGIFIFLVLFAFYLLGQLVRWLV